MPSFILALLVALVLPTSTGPLPAAAPPPAAAPLPYRAPQEATTPPNVVLVVTDDQTLDSIRYMPYLQGQREAGDLVDFTQTESNNPLCCPGRATILTGQVDTRTGVENNAQATNIRPAETLAVPLHAAGYRTGIFGKLLNGYNEESAPWPGWDDFQPVVSRNIYAQYDYQIVNNSVVESYGNAPTDYQVDVLTAKAQTFVRNTPADQPLFLYLAPTSTHTPFVAAPRHQGAFADQSIPLPANFGEADVSDKPAWVQQLPIPGRGGAVSQRRNQYAAGLSVDDMIRSIDDTLAATQRLDNTVLIFVSDNGLSAGSNRWTSKMCELRGCVAVPMLVRYPGQQGRSEQRLASTIDIAPTIVDLAGTTLPVRPDGMSLLPAITDPTGTVPTHDALLEHWPGGNQEGNYSSASYPTPGFYAIRTDRWRYAEVTNLDAPGGTEYELYDELADPGELTNRATDPSLATVRSDLQARMYDLIRATGATPGAPQGSWRPSVAGVPDDGLSFLLRNSNTPGPADVVLPFGQAGDVPLSCDWDGDGKDTAGVFRDGLFSLRNSLYPGPPSRQFSFGRAGDLPVCGDWNGTGVDTVGVFRAGTFYLRNSNSSGPANITSSYGRAGDQPVAGDWDGNGHDSFGVVRAATWFLSDRTGAPVTAYKFGYGRDTDRPLTGDWTARGSDTVGVRRDNVFYLRNALSGGPADIVAGYGTTADRGLAGNWDGVAGDSVGVARIG